MKLHVQILSVVCLIIGLTGCQSPRDEASLFRRKHSSESVEYIMLEPTSLDHVVETIYVMHSGFKGLVGGVMMRKDDPQELEKYLKRQQCVIESIETNVIKRFEKLREDVRRNGGQAFYYRRRKIERIERGNVPMYETGMLIIRNGKVIYDDGSGH